MNDNTAIAGIGILFLLCVLAIAAVVIAGMWKVFTKAGQPGWASLVPIYNVIVILTIVGRPLWWVLLYLVPFVNIVIAIVIMIDLAKCFGKGAGFGVGLVILGFIFFPVLGFGDAEYRSPAPALV